MEIFGSIILAVIGVFIGVTSYKEFKDQRNSPLARFICFGVSLAGAGIFIVSIYPFLFP